MARWMREETRIRLKELVEQRVPRAAIINRLGITSGQFVSQCKIQGLDPKKTAWGLGRIREDLRGARK